MQPEIESLDGPLASLGIRPFDRPTDSRSDAEPGALTPLALRVLRRAPSGAIPNYVFDPVTQVIAQDDEDDEPKMKKDWTTVEGTHTDGDGGDNESWGWEEV